MKLFDIPHGTGGVSWLFWIVAIASLLFVFLPSDSWGQIGLLAAIFAGIKIEANSIRHRLKKLEASIDTNRTVA